MKLGMFTIETLLATLLRRSVRKEYTKNVSLAEDGAISPFSLPPDDSLVAVVHTSDGRDLVFTASRLLDTSGELLQYSDVVKCHWIIDSPDFAAKARLKATHFDRLVLELRGHRRLEIDHLRQSVFPLLKFFESIQSDA